MKLKVDAKEKDFLNSQPLVPFSLNTLRPIFHTNLELVGI
jgi:hypothetical protein